MIEILRFLKRHWILTLAIVLFLYAVHKASDAISKAAALLALVSFAFYWGAFGLLLRVFLAVFVVVTTNYIYGYLPPWANAFTNWIPRSKSVTTLNADLSTQ